MFHSGETWRSRRFETILVCTACISIASISAAPCSYQNPREEEIVIGGIVRADTEKEKRHSKRDVSETSDSLIEDDYQPLRIHLHYDETIQSLSPDKQIYVNSTLLPQATGFWEEALRVRRAKLPILLKRKCIESYYLLDKAAGVLACGKACATVTMCGESVVPTDHLQSSLRNELVFFLFQSGRFPACRFCLDSGGCGRVGRAGSGVPDADFILYVSSSESSRCDRNDTLAYAAHCQLDTILDRPIAGHVNLCPSALSTHTNDQEVLVSTVKHEILHALAFSAGLFAFYRDDDGRPRTRRNQYGKPVSLNREKGYYEWDKTTIDTVLRTDWWTSEGTVVHAVKMLVTPRVVEEVRQHFGCNTLEGAELENQGGDGTAITHWEKRVFENEAMTGTHTQNPVYSRITFALLEDTGWYKANYDIAEDLHWGKGLGCEFSQKSCGDWIHNRKENGSSLQPFCDDIKHDGRRSLAVTKCTLGRDSVALCNLIPYSTPLPRAFRNLANLNGIQEAGLRYYGGSVELADFCPYNQEFEWKSPSPRNEVRSVDGELEERRRDSRCEIDSNKAEDDDLLELYGKESRCFDLVRPWTERKCGRIRTFSHYLAGCYHHECVNGTLFISIFNASDPYPCYSSGQPIYIRRIVDGWLREGTLLCPDCSELCSFCSFSALGDSTTTFIGDPLLDEPCVGTDPHAIFYSILITLIFLFVSNR